MGVKTQLAMIAALGCAALLLLRWSPSDIVKINYSASANIRGLLGQDGKGTHRAGAGCAAAPSPKPPVSIEWTGRESMTVSYKEGVDVEVYKHEFPGSTLCAWGGCGACALAAAGRCCLLASLPPSYPALYPCPHPPPSIFPHSTAQGWTFGTA
jgi:hypothetical protein